MVQLVIVEKLEIIKLYLPTKVISKTFLLEFLLAITSFCCLGIVLYYYDTSNIFLSFRTINQVLFEPQFKCVFPEDEKVISGKLTN